MSFVVVRPVWADALVTDWFDRPRTYESFYDPGLVPLPPVAVTKQDIMNNVDIANQGDLAGYQEWGTWYKHALSRIHNSLDGTWVPTPSLIETNFTTDALRRQSPGAYDSLFSDVTFGQFQVSAAHAVKALRLIPKKSISTATGMNG